MKYALTLFFILFVQTVNGQEWINDDNYSDKVTGSSAFDDDQSEIIIVEFWVEFNKSNAFSDWKKLDDLEGVTYYRCDIATSPKLKKELRIRMAPTLLIYTKGDAYIKFKAKAGLDLVCPVDYPKMLRAIEAVKRESQF
tara:strand:+ start:1189 stop:1605 length:417 start_codon:yes stop_codon:yes gene_type:complete